MYELKTINELQKKYLNGEIDFKIIEDAMNAFTKKEIIKKTLPTFIMASISLLCTLVMKNIYLKTFLIICNWATIMLNLRIIYDLLLCRDKFLEDFKNGDKIWGEK